MFRTILKKEGTQFLERCHFYFKKQGYLKDEKKFTEICIARKKRDYQASWKMLKGVPCRKKVLLSYIDIEVLNRRSSGIHQKPNEVLNESPLHFYKVKSSGKVLEVFRSPEMGRDFYIVNSRRQTIYLISEDKKRVRKIKDKKWEKVASIGSYYDKAVFIQNEGQKVSRFLSYIHYKKDFFEAPLTWPKLERVYIDTTNMWRKLLNIPKKAKFDLPYIKAATLKKGLLKEFKKVHIEPRERKAEMLRELLRSNIKLRHKAMRICGKLVSVEHKAKIAIALRRLKYKVRLAMEEEEKFIKKRKQNHNLCMSELMRRKKALKKEMKEKKEKERRMALAKEKWERTMVRSLKDQSLRELMLKLTGDEHQKLDRISRIMKHLTETEWRTLSEGDKREIAMHPYLKEYWHLNFVFMYKMYLEKRLAEEEEKEKKKKAFLLEAERLKKARNANIPEYNPKKEPRKTIYTPDNLPTEVYLNDDWIFKVDYDSSYTSEKVSRILGEHLDPIYIACRRCRSQIFRLTDKVELAMRQNHRKSTWHKSVGYLLVHDLED